MNQHERHVITIVGTAQRQAPTALGMGFCMPVQCSFATSTTPSGSDTSKDDRLDARNPDGKGYDGRLDDVDNTDGGQNVEDLEIDSEEAPFPRLGWSPGSFGARALRPSRKRKPGEPTGRTKPPRTENDYWHEAGVYDVSTSNKKSSK